MSSERAVGPVIGVILIVAIVLTVAVTVAAFGAAMIQDTQSSIEHSQTETAFSQLAVDASELRENGSRVDFELGHQDGQVRTVDDTGNLVVELEQGGTPRELTETPLRSLVYERDGKQVAYQGGGVFRKQDGGSSLVSAPEFFYRDNSLVFPVTKLDGDVRQSGTLDGSLKLSKTKQVYPNESAGMGNPLDSGTLYIRLESEYCQGWEEYFDSQTRGSVTDSCGSTDDTDPGEVKVELSVPFELDGSKFTHAIGAGEFDDDEADNANVTQIDPEDFPSADSLIATKKAQCEAKDDDEWGLDDDEDIDEGGLYCVEGIDEDHTFDVDEMSEDAEVYVDGDVVVSGNGLPIEGSSDDNSVSLFVDGNFHMNENGAVVGIKRNPSLMRIFVSSDGYVFNDDDGSNTRGKVYAAVYAPESEGHLKSKGNSEFKGSMVVGEFGFDSGNVASIVGFDPSVRSIQTTYESAGPEFYYLHLVEKTMTIRS